jgi:hypothetical protein
MTSNIPNDLHDFEDLPTPKTKAELLERMAIAYDAAESLLAAHDEAALTRPLSDSGWSAKDYFAHLMVWEGSLVSLLEKRDRLKQMGLERGEVNLSDFDGMNDILYQLHKDRPLDDVLNAFRQTHQQLLTLLADVEDEDLHKPYGLYQPHEEGDHTKNPIIGWFAGDTYGHYAEHVLDIGRLLAE